jgi:hypothetical protein
MRASQRQDLQERLSVAERLVADLQGARSHAIAIFPDFLACAAERQQTTDALFSEDDPSFATTTAFQETVRNFY